MNRKLGFLILCIVMATQTARAECGAIPYSIQFKSAHGELGVTVPEEVKARLGQLSANTGGSFVKSGFAAVSQIAFSELLDYYQCAINEHVAADSTITADQKVGIANNVRMAVTALRVKASMYFSAFAQGNGDLILAYSTDLESKSRDANGPTVDMKVLLAALAKVDLISTFQISTAKNLWGNVNVKGVTVTACGAYIKSALVANAGVIQGVASGTRAVLYDYLDGSNPQMVQTSLARLFLLASSAATPVVPTGVEVTANANNCAAAAKA